MLRPLTWSPVVAVCVLAVGVAAAAAGGPRPEAPPTVPATGTPQPEAPPATRAEPPPAPRPRPTAARRAPVAVARAHSTTSPTALHHVEAARRQQPARATTTARKVVVPAKSRPARAIDQPPLIRLPLVPSLHPDASEGGSAGSYGLVALAAGLLLLGGCSLAITLAELRREPA